MKVSLTKRSKTSFKKRFMAGSNVELHRWDRALECREMERYILLLTWFAVITFISSSCVSTPPDVTAIGFIVSASVNWDDDPAPDGVAFALRPQDADGFMVKAEGNLSAKLWSQPDRFAEKKGELIQEWNGIHVTRRDYDKRDLAARIRLEYADYKPTLGECGILEVIFTLPGGKSFTFSESNISLNPPQGMREQLAPGCCP
jgi:hypothetical protein